MPECLPPLNGLYAITPDTTDTPLLVQAVIAVLAGGCRWLQYRNKLADETLRRHQGATLAALCQERGAALIINDDMNLAHDLGAAGVHLGREDGALQRARELLGPEAVIGASCYQDLGLARAAARAGASYVAFGAVYPSPTKPDAARAPLELFRQARAELGLPVCAIGGIQRDNVLPLIQADAGLVAVITDLFQDMHDPEAIRARTATYQQYFKEHS